jgi:hypothetical protein
VRLHADRHAKVQRVASALGISAAAYLDALLEHEELDERDRPVWWQDPAPAEQEELPLAQTA